MAYALRRFRPEAGELRIKVTQAQRCGNADEGLAEKLGGRLITQPLAKPLHQTHARKCGEARLFSR